MLVMPSLNRMNSILPSTCSQWGNRDSTSRRADACDSAVLYESGMYRSCVEGSSGGVVEDILFVNGSKEWLAEWR